LTYGQSLLKASKRLRHLRTHTIITEFLRYLLSNIYEDIVLVDGNGHIALLAQKTGRVFGLDRGRGKWENVL
jgi:hypothetical protein